MAPSPATSCSPIPPRRPPISLLQNQVGRLAIAIGTRPRRLTNSPGKPPPDEVLAHLPGSPTIHKAIPKHPPVNARLPARVPKEWLDMSNQFGGCASPKNYGRAVREIQKRHPATVCRKINIGHRHRLAFTAAAVRGAARIGQLRTPATSTSRPVGYMEEGLAFDSVTRQFWCAGQAASIKQRREHPLGLRPALALPDRRLRSM